jgi:hypothetical protein
LKPSRGADNTRRTRRSGSTGYPVVIGR